MIAKDRFRLDIRKFSFKNRVIDQWNHLPAKVVEAKSVYSFERLLDKIWDGSDVMYNPDANLHELTNHRRIRSAHPTIVAEPVDLSEVA